MANKVKIHIKVSIRHGHEVTPNQSVNAGDVLFKFDDTDLRAKLASSARARMDNGQTIDGRRTDVGQSTDGSDGSY